MTIAMQPRHLLLLFLTSLAISANAAESIYFKFSDLLQSDSARKPMDPTVNLYWGDQATPHFQEVARPDINTGSSISGGLSGGSRKHCVEAFEEALNAMISNARSGGYDAIVNIRVARGKKPVDDPLGFNCTLDHQDPQLSQRAVCSRRHGHRVSTKQEDGKRHAASRDGKQELGPVHPSVLSWRFVEEASAGA